MLQRFLNRALDRLGPRYARLVVTLELCTAFVVTLGAIGLLTLYIDFGPGQLWRFVVVAEGLTAAAVTVGVARVWRLLEPVSAWLEGARGPEATAAAWRTAIGLPYRLVRQGWATPLFVVALPVSLFAYLSLDLNLLEAVTVFVGSSITIAYAFVLHYFALEIVMRPLVARIDADLPRDFVLSCATLPLRWKLIATLPLMSVVTGVVVAGLSATNRGIEDLGLDVFVAVAVAFTLSLELTLLIAQSISAPVRELLEGTRRVGEGDFSVRVPISANDELAELERGFNEMVDGLAERERLREALGSYVAPDVAERVLEEGANLAGEEIAVTVLFLDIVGFTGLAENKDASEIVSFLNGFFGLVVPVVNRHGGHLDKFLGDGLVAVFGVPMRTADHADLALAAALEIQDAVEARYGGDVEAGIGLNSGVVVAGTIGGGGRLEFTVIGDAVNTAARVEEATRLVGDRILLTEATRELLSDGGVELVPRAPRLLRGKSEKTALFAPVPVAREPDLDAEEPVPGSLAAARQPEIP